MTDSGPPVLSIVVPAYNETRRVGRSLEKIREYAIQTNAPCELIVVDDGSRDGTVELVRRFAAERASSDAARMLRVQLLENASNQGKGYSVRRGMLAASGDMLLMSDADLSAPIEEVEKLRPWLAQGYDVAIGSRHMPESVVDPPRPFLRRLMDKMFRAARRRLLLPDIRDTQCGFKLFTRRAAREIFARQTEDGFAFDCEVLALAQQLGFRVREVGVRWSDARESRVRPLRDAPAMLWSLRRIRRRLAANRRSGGQS